MTQTNIHTFVHSTMSQTKLNSICISNKKNHEKFYTSNFNANHNEKERVKIQSLNVHKVKARRDVIL